MFPPFFLHCFIFCCIFVNFSFVIIILVVAFFCIFFLNVLSLHFFSFLKNISLISCFLGLGIGYALKNRSLISLNWVFPLTAIQILILYFFSQTPISTILINPIVEQFSMGMDTARSVSHILIIYFFILFIFYFGNL